MTPGCTCISRDDIGVGIPAAYATWLADFFKGECLLHGHEQWLPIPGFDVYEVSTKGRVRRCGRIISQKLWGGYRQVMLHVGGKRFERKVHRLVLTAFDRAPMPREECNHKNGDKLCNDLSNLEWVTTGENQHHAYAIGLKRLPRGEVNPRALLTENDVVSIRAARGLKTQSQLGEEYRVSRSLIGAIQQRKAWAHVG